MPFAYVARIANLLPCQRVWGLQRKAMFEGQVVAITGARGGIGAAFARAFADAGAKLSLSDLEGPDDVAAEMGALSLACDAGSEDAVKDFIDQTEAALGPIDIFIANAGVGFGDPTVAASADDKAWETSWQVNVMQGVYAARALLPGWVERGSGRFVVVASAAGLLNQIGSASYSATKAAAIALAENIAITHAKDGVKAHAVCPQFVRTAMTEHMDLPEGSPLSLKEPEDVASALLDAIREDRFLALSHPVVGKYALNKATDRDRWLAGMSQLQETMGAQLGLQAFKETKA